MSLSIADHTGQMWLTGFNEIGESLIGMTANQLMEIKVRFLPAFESVCLARNVTDGSSPLLQDNDESQFEKEVNKSLGKLMNFNCQGKMDTFGVRPRSFLSAARIAS